MTSRAILSSDKVGGVPNFQALSTAKKIGRMLSIENKRTSTTEVVSERVWLSLKEHVDILSRPYLLPNDCQTDFVFSSNKDSLCKLLE